MRPVETFLQEVKYLAEQHGVDCIYFADEPYVDATITREELLAALKKQRGETSLQDDVKRTIR